MKLECGVREVGGQFVATSEEFFEADLQEEHCEKTNSEFCGETNPPAFDGAPFTGLAGQHPSTLKEAVDALLTSVPQDVQHEIEILSQEAFMASAHRHVLEMYVARDWVLPGNRCSPDPLDRSELGRWMIAHRIYESEPARNVILESFWRRLHGQPVVELQPESESERATREQAEAKRRQEIREISESLSAVFERAGKDRGGNAAEPSGSQ